MIFWVTRMGRSFFPGVVAGVLSSRHRRCHRGLASASSRAIAPTSAGLHMSIASGRWANTSAPSDAAIAATESRTGRGRVEDNRALADTQCSHGQPGGIRAVEDVVDGDVGKFGTDQSDQCEPPGTPTEQRRARRG